MQNLLKRLGVTLLGLVAMLAWWTFTGDRSGSTTKEGIPAKVWEGGGQITIEIESSTPARFSMTFSESGEEGEKRSMEAWEKVAAGSHSWTVDVPAGISGYIDLTSENPQTGARLSWKIKVAGNVVDEQNETLDKPLQAGYAFGIQAYFSDYAKGKLGDEDDD